MFARDSRGERVTTGCFVKVEVPGRKAWSGWVEASADEGRVPVMDVKKGFVRWVRPVDTRVCKPSTMDVARREGQRKSIAHVSAQSKKRRGIR